MTGAKSALEVKDEMTFLDLTVRQIEHLNTTHKVDVPLILMTSFNTHEDTLRIIKKYANQQLRITTFNQSRYPRILKEGLLPAPSSAADDKDKWYPPGHGGNNDALNSSMGQSLTTCRLVQRPVAQWCIGSAHRRRQRIPLRF
jgi:UTP--glucose-1-phosphate uridylyltransferase